MMLVELELTSFPVGSVALPPPPLASFAVGTLALPPPLAPAGTPPLEERALLLKDTLIRVHYVTDL